MVSSVRSAGVFLVLFVASCTSTSGSGTASSLKLSTTTSVTAPTANSSTTTGTIGTPESICQAALPPGYSLYTARTSSVGELRHQLSSIGSPVVSDTVPELFPGLSNAASATQCWGRSASTFVVYAVGPNDRFIEFCETTFAGGDLPETQPPVC